MRIFVPPRSILRLLVFLFDPVRLHSYSETSLDGLLIHHPTIQKDHGLIPRQVSQERRSGKEKETSLPG